ncbi:MAG: hydroxyacid dehydrogenase [Anaerolineae bacterium]|nr:hydroxyacid dehydrogenase [Anaerolineae bacterium]
MAELSVHLDRPYVPGVLEHLRSLLEPGIRLTVGPDLPAPARYHVLVAGRPSPEEIAASPNLCALIVPWAGIPPATRELLRGFPHIAVHNLHYNDVTTAEMAVTLMLAAAKRIVPIDRTFRQHDWTPRYQPNPSLALEGRTALILGYGAIGQRVARACRGLGMRVLAIRRCPEKAPPGLPDAVHPPHALRQLLPQADVLVVCLPHTPETEGLIGAGELALLPAQALLVNVARGPIVDEAALYHALCDGTLYGAGLDVWYNYPADEAARPHTPPSAYPFHELDNVVMSPHRAGGSVDKEERRMARLAVLLNAARRGEEMPNRVDLAAGY